MKPLLTRRTPSCRIARAAWLGALIEGEGSVIYSRANLQRQPKMRISAGSTEIETIATVLRLAGCGHISYLPVRSHSLGSKPMWRWDNSSSARTVEILCEIAPFLTSKQERALEMVRDYVLNRKQFIARRVKVRAARLLSAYGYGEFAAPVDRRRRWQQIGGPV